MKKLTAFTLLLFTLFCLSCNKNPDIDDASMLDGNIIFDPSLRFPENYRISAYLPAPTSLQKDTPVIIAAHGYTATTFEWDELRAFANDTKSFYVSQVLLGGHGRTYADFKKSTWKDWQSSIKEEYSKLCKLGFRKIYLAGSSTGAPLLIDLVHSGFFATQTTQPKGIFLIDPIVVSSNKTLTMIGLLGPLLGYATVELETGEQGHWYVYRPQETLKQLMDLINFTRKNLEAGIDLPTGTYMKVYKSVTDDVADPISALMIYKGMSTASKGKIDVELTQSKLHVFTRLAGRKNVSTADRDLQQRVFREMELKMKE